MKTFGGQVLFLDRSDINTDEIIPAKYLTEVKKEAMGPHLLEDLKLPGFDPKAQELRDAKVVVTRANFGCGSSREHAPWALEVNGITLVVAESYARIFRQNMFNCGMLAVELDARAIQSVFALRDKGTVQCRVDVDKKELAFVASDGSNSTQAFSLNAFDESLVRAGGWVEFADSRY